MGSDVNDDGSPKEAGKNGSTHYFALAAGSKLFEFEIISVLGYGGFGITYLAMDTLLEERVALKEFFPNDLAVRVTDATVRAKSGGEQPEFQAGLKTFLTEARLMARFRHRNIVHVRRFFELHGTGYIVQDYENGQTLSERLDRGPIGEPEFRQILAGVLDGLEAVHNRAVLHRDVKPDNIILREDGTPVLIDFGAARDFASQRSRSMTAIAAGSYTSPEQWGAGGQQGPWSDLYALGATLYRCATGTSPPTSLQRLRTDPLVPATTAAKGKYDPALLRTIDWMLAVDETQRPASIEAVRGALASGSATPQTDEETSSGSVTNAGAESKNGLIHATAIWPADALPKKTGSWRWLIAASILIAGAIAAAGYNFYATEPHQAEQQVQHLDAQQRGVLIQPASVANAAREEISAPPSQSNEHPPLPPAAPAPVARPETPTLALNDFATRDNRDMYGGDIPLPSGKIGYQSADINECAARCETTSSCVAFSFNRWKNVCYLKNNIPISILDASSTIAVKSPLQLPDVSVAAAQIEIFRNRSLRGTLISRNAVSNFEACKTNCDNDNSLRRLQFH